MRKPITNIGRAPGNDIVVPQASVESQHAQIVFSGRDFEIEGLSGGDSTLINGKRKRRARLVNGDRLQLGEAVLSFSMMSEFLPRQSERPASMTSEIVGLERLFQFTEQLVSTENVDQLLETLLDNVIELTGAARGMVLILENGDTGTPSVRVRASRNVKREQLPAQDDALATA